MVQFQDVLQPRRDFLYGRSEQWLRNARGGRTEYQALLRDLDSKYGHVKGIVRKENDSKDGTRKSVSYTGSDGMACMVSLYQSEGMNNSMYWYVTLDYWREDLKTAAQEEIIKEM